MTLDYRDEIARIIAQAEREAYARGVRDTIARLSVAAEELLDHPIESTKSLSETTATSSRGRPSKAINMVRDAIFAEAGMTGVEVVKAVQGRENSIPERTIRTCLRRLRINKQVWQRDGRWYPKKEKFNVIGETLESSPH